VDPIARQLVTRLRQDPRDEAAYESLKAHYFEQGDLASLANLLEGWAGRNEDAPEPSSQAYVEAARAVLQSGGDALRARALYERALALHVLHPDAAHELLSILEQSGDAQALFEMLDRYAQRLEHVHAAPALTASVYARLGQVCEESYARPDLAAQYYERAQLFGAQAGGAPAPAQRSTPRDDAALAAYDHELKNTHDPERRVEIMSALARTHAEQYGDVQSAILVLRRALGEAPGDVQVLHQLATYLLTRAESAAPDEAHADRSRAAELLYQIAQGVDEQQSVTYLESSLDVMPSHDGALTLLEHALERAGQAHLLPRRWVAYVAAVGESPASDARRLALGEAYLNAGQTADAAECLQPLAERGSVRAHELLQHVYAAEGQSHPPPREPEAERDALPTVRPLRITSDERAVAASRVSQLRKQLHEQIASRQQDESAETCRKILEIDPNDPEAFNLLESHHRKRRDYQSLRDLLLASTRSPGLSVDARKVRLREVATLSESKLRDAEGAISAFRGVVTLDPSDRDALRSLKRLLKKAERWDDLASVIDREALTTTDAEEKAGLIHEVALIHRDKRNDPAETAEALRQLHALRPDDAAVRDELCELCLQLNYLEDAARLLRERIDVAADEREKLRSLGQLAALLHERLSDPEAAYATCETILAIRANDKTAFDRMERIDEEIGNSERLLKTLERRTAQVSRNERGAMLVRMGIIADEKLGNSDKAAEHLGEALDLAPDNAEVLERLVHVFERSGNHDELAELLRERAIIEKAPAARAVLYRKLAEVLANDVRDESGAVEAYEKLLAIEADEPALQYLRGVALAHGQHEKLAGLLKQLVLLAPSNEAKRDLEHERALLLRDELQRPAEALLVLRELVEKLDGGFVPSIDALEGLASELDDKPALALALERKLALTSDAGSRVRLARQLADLAELELDDKPRAIAALTAWATASEREAEPRRRLQPLLRSEQRYAELVETLDALAAWEDALDARDAALIEAASVAFEHLKDAESAWKRLMPLAEEGHIEAETLLASIARKSERAQPLAALYIRLAQSAEGTRNQIAYWRKAVEVFEQDLQQVEQALEAALRMLAADMSDRDSLELVDRLAIAAKAYKRLSQVYDRLLRDAQGDDDKAHLLARQATALETDEPDEALDRLLRACSVLPDDEALLVRTEELAQKRKRTEDLLVVYDRRRARAQDDAGRVAAILRAAQACDAVLRDRERAMAYVKQALTLASTEPLREQLTRAVRDLDAARPEQGAESARRAFVRAHKELAEKAPAALASELIRRGATVLVAELNDERSAFDFLRQGVSLVPLDDALYEKLLDSSTRLKRLDALDAHLSRMIDEAIDSNVTVALLRRRGRLLEGPLDRAKDAAQVFAKLLQLRADDEEATQKLRAGLRAAGRFQDLLVALAKQLQRTKDNEQRTALLSEIALTWQNDLKNRWEAIDAWKAVLVQAPDDARAKSAIERLERGKGTVPGDLDAPSEADEASTAERAEANAESAAEAVANEGATSAEDELRRAAPEADAADQASDIGEPDTESTPDERTEEEVLPIAAAAVAPEPAAAPAQTASEARAEEESDDLAALDADLSVLGRGIEEVSFEEAPMEIDDSAFAGPRSTAVRSSAPPPPSTRRSGQPPAPPPARERRSTPPPLPPRASTSTSPGSTSEPGVRPSVPPPLPRRR
jgi:hypothetical protein